jgi:hypothetical protein
MKFHLNLIYTRTNRALSTPSTIIGYSILANSNVTLKVFDLPGREVVTLVNEKQNAGVYNYQFRMTDFEMVSGVYFYQLRAVDISTGKELVQTRKMVLIR